jgi:hypothetical protein
METMFKAHLSSLEGGVGGNQRNISNGEMVSTSSKLNQSISQVTRFSLMNI